LQQNPGLVQQLQFLLDQHRQQPAPGVLIPGPAYVAAEKILRTPLSALTSSSLLAQPCDPTYTEKAHNMREALRYGWKDVECVQGSVRIEVNSEHLPTERFLADLLRLFC
jgi:hypothetical protein